MAYRDRLYRSPIPLSLLAAGLVLFQSGASVNTMTLAGFVIALGIVVDDAILGRLRTSCGACVCAARGRQREARRASFWTLRSRCGAPIVYATLIVVTAVVPVLFMQGLTGSFFQATDYKPICSRLRPSLAAAMT